MVEGRLASRMEGKLPSCSMTANNDVPRKIDLIMELVDRWAEVGVETLACTQARACSP